MGSTDAQFVVEPVKGESWRVFGDQEGLDGGASERGIERGPYDDRITAIAGCDDDFFAVQHPLIAVAFGGGTDGCGVCTCVRFGDGHGGPSAFVAGFLFVVGDGGDGGIAETLARDTQREADVTPAQFHKGECGDRKSTRLNSSHVAISYAVFCLKKKKH